MIVKRAIAFLAACSTAATPCLAADLGRFDDSGARRSGAVVGAYVELPFGGPRSGRTQAGLALTMSHDYRDAAAPDARVMRAQALDLRLVGDRQATLYLAGRPVTGEEARRRNEILGTAGTIVTVVIVAAAIVGGIVILNAIDDSGDE